MLNISGIHEGFVLDHIQAGMSLQIYHDLKLDKLDCSVAIIKNAKSNKMGKKDIIKVECPIEALDLDILGFIDHNITVNVIKGDRIVEKKELKLPKQVKNVIKCKNPRCVTSIEQELDQIFILADEEKEVYRCKYCEEKYTNPNRRQKRGTSREDVLLFLGKNIFKDQPGGEPYRKIIEADKTGNIVGGFAVIPGT